MTVSLFARLARRFGPAGAMGRTTDEERREFLRASLAASAGLMLGGARGAIARPRADPREGVIVVGAGLAGLACAHALVEAGREVVVLEARGRVGGRVLSVTDAIPGHPGRVVEAGGEFVGANHGLWQGFAARFGLTLEEVPEEAGEAPIILEGAALKAEEARALYGEMRATLSRLNDLARAIDADAPWTTPDAPALDARSVADWLAGERGSARSARAIRAQMESDNGLALERQSLLGALAMIRGGGVEAFWTESETHRCRGGSRRLAEAFARALGAERLRMRAQVVTIGDAGDRAWVEIAGGERIQGEAVVVASPPSVWDRVRFEGFAPAGGGLGEAVKWIGAVKRRYWRDSGLSAESLRDEAPAMTWESTSGGPESDGVALTAFSGGPAARAAREGDAGARERRHREALERSHPGLMREFLLGRFYDWPGDEWTKGGYSFPAPGEVTTTVRALASAGGAVRFAGERCSCAFPGYMEGALRSGALAARSILGAHAG